MGRIIELSHHVANQIAAGEVVERPLSVIKELLENALDAGAKNIEIRLKDGGLSYLVVQDDGCGMDEDDAALATKRYATSKLTNAHDLLLRAYAYIQPEISFKFFSEEKLVFSSPSDDQNLARAHALLGQDTKGMLHEINTQTDLVSLKGAIAAPMITRRDARGMVIFVNNRLIHDKKLAGAIKASFRTLLEVGRHPIGALSLSIAPDEVDVNVHPRKTEIRFVNERRVMSHVISLLSSFLSQTPWLTHAQAHDNFNLNSNFSKFSQNISDSENMGSYDFLYASPLAFTQTNAHVQTHVQTTQSLLPTAKFSELRVIGQVHTTYLLLESHEGLVVIDQHAAHERISFERIRAARDIALISKTLLIPMSFELSRTDVGLALEHVEDFRKLGIDLAPFSETTLVVRAVPDFIEQENVQALIEDILAELAEHGRADALNQIHDHLCATIACHSSIRAGQRLGKEEIQALLIELDQIDFGAHCPHGRPVVKSFASSEMKKWFHRT